jgi:hypothetical protein
LHIYEAQLGPAMSPAPVGLEDIWLSVDGLMRHAQLIRQNEENMQAQQRGMIRDGCFLMPSPFADRKGDRCNQSWFHEYQFYYLFDAGTHGNYYWITGSLGRGYNLDTIWFPSRQIAVTIHRYGIDAERLNRFQNSLLQPPAKANWAPLWEKAPRTAVVGYQHLVHMLWNELPALDRLVGTTLPDVFDIAVQCEPYGPTKELYPELAARIHTVRYEDIPELNAANGMVLGLGSWTITRGTQARVRRVAAMHTSEEAITQRDRFKAEHTPVFWLSVKPPLRTLTDQSAHLASLIGALQAFYPKAGFILDGASDPWDFPANSNYFSWFHENAQRAREISAKILAEIMESARVERKKIVNLNGITACEEVMWGEAADFYICHGGTMQNKIGWVHRIPGFIHSNRAFLESFRTMPLPIAHDAPPCYLASHALIVDDDINRYSANQLARKDQNYEFSSLGTLIDEVMAAVEATL